MARVAWLGFHLLQPDGGSPGVVQEVEAWDEHVGPNYGFFAPVDPPADTAGAPC